ncbi:MAG: hypothetical protein IJ125_06920 [Atopobiaceae bacterium]|nr:hypothetical protein [Atopobiaceae bacterium]
MIQANMLEAKTELSKLVQKLESGQEDVIYIARNNVPVVQMQLIDLAPNPQRIGVAEGKFVVPDSFDTWDDELEELFDEL